MIFFSEPTVLRSEPVVDLEFGVSTLQLPGGGSQLTRGFNGGVPGPTIRTAPGELLRIRLSNTLRGKGVSTGQNSFMAFNTTSLHTHGLHVSPRRPSDDALFQVAPGEEADYEYHIPPNHMGGTHWYHPHVHGASTMQVGGGAMGMLIVDDPPGLLPLEVASVQERHLIISDLRVPSLARVAQRYAAACRDAGGRGAVACQEPFWTDAAARRPGTSERVLLVNGQHEPVMRIDAQQWYRLRLLFASSGGGASTGGRMMNRRLDAVHGRGLSMMMGGDDEVSDWSGDDLFPALRDCETSLLAKDGVYLHRAPRVIARGVMSAGNRADWLVRCPPGKHALVDESSGATLIRIIAVATPAPPAAPIVPFRVSRPCYLVDLTHARPSARHAFTLAHMGFAIATDGQERAWNGAEYPAATFPVGKVVELTLGGTSTMHHVFHVHVNPFQLQDAPSLGMRDVSGNYFEAGDFHDTFRAKVSDRGGMMAAMNAAPVRVRLQTDAFTGLVPLHCHYLVHEDQGMLATIRIEGPEGTSFEGAEELDATCYRNATPGKWVRVDTAAEAAEVGSAPVAATALPPQGVLYFLAPLTLITMALGARRRGAKVPVL